MNELAQALGVDASTVSRTIRPLIDLALIERRAGASDRREACLVPTTAGLRQAEAIAEERRTMTEAVHQHLTPEQLALFADLFEDYMRAIAIEGRRIVADETPGA
jgi:DNA-binding MarR family transcriptional regulator